MNCNADALSRLPCPASPKEMAAVAPGISGPLSTGPLAGSYALQIPCSLIDAFPVWERADLQTLQEADPVIGPFLRFWRRGQSPTSMERKEIPADVLELVRQWQRLGDRDGVLYRHVQPPEGGRRVWQLVLPRSLRSEVLVALHDDQGHQGCERTTSLVRQRCYWPNMRKDIEKWCQECERCSLAKAVQPKVRTFPGNLLASRPLEVVAIDFTILERAIDALLGTHQEGQFEVPVEDWITRHQEYLRSAYELAGRHLQEAAAQRVQQQPKGNVDRLPPGTIVYRKNHVLGRHKIQDVWDAKKYRIVKCLDEVGRVYTITPVEGDGRRHNIHRTEVRVAPGPTPQVVPGEGEELAPCPVSRTEAQDDQDDESEWSGPVVVVASRDPEPRAQTVTVRPPAPLSEPGEAREECSSPPKVRPTADLTLVSCVPPATVGSVRRTGRATAGLNSNPHHLPRTSAAQGDGQVGAAAHLHVDTIQAYFRPWC
ncbi:hypothetical protein MHYP_G00147480 [Metynnis hypsauchen]